MQARAALENAAVRNQMATALQPDGEEPPKLDSSLVGALEHHKADYHKHYQQLQQLRSAAKQLEAMIQVAMYVKHTEFIAD